MDHQQIRRRDNGTIDMDFYRQQAMAARREVMTEFVGGISRAARPLIAVAALGLAVYATATRSSSPDASEVRNYPAVQYKGTLVLLRTIQPI